MLPYLLPILICAQEHELEGLREDLGDEAVGAMSESSDSSPLDDENMRFRINIGEPRFEKF